MTLADENLHSAIWRGLLRRNCEIDIVRVQDVGILSFDDPAVLEWAAQENRIVISSDTNTLIRFAIERIDSGIFMPGVIVVPQDLAIGAAIEDILLLAECGEPSDIENQVVYLPFR
jgi:hypothetical protein